MALDEQCIKHVEQLARVEENIETLYRKVRVIEDTVEVIHELATSVAVMTEQIKNINVGVNNLNTHLEIVDKKIEQIEITPTKEYNGIKQRVVHAAIDFVVAAALAGVAWAIIQVYK